jgi:hypothetical protein
LREPVLYTIDHAADGIPPFYYWFPLSHPGNQRRIRGEYEIDVMERLSTLCDRDTELWEVGAAWGYHSMAVAGQVDTIRSFEPMTEPLQLLEKSAQENGFDNIITYEVAVESLDAYLDDGIPDIILMDIDGWEYNVVSNSLETLQERPIWLIELHTDPTGVPDEAVRPHDVVQLLNNHGYHTEEFGERGSFDRFGRQDTTKHAWYVLATPEWFAG